jgi:hypothetical protein
MMAAKESGSCEISSSPSVGSETLKTFEDALRPGFAVKRRTLLQATAGIPPEAIYFAFGFVANSVSSGFFNAIGEEAFGRLKSAIMSRLFEHSREERTISFSFKTGETEMSFNCTTDNPSTISAALDAIPEIVRTANKTATYYFNNDSLSWEE